MGLDMYLQAERYVSHYFDEADGERAAKIKEIFPEFTNAEIKTIRAEVAYWRKANAIHAWFVANCQGGVDECQDTGVAREQLEELRQLCLEVLDTKDASKLPPQAGFFFGSTEVNDWYYEDLRNTVEQLNKVLAMPDNLEFYYRSSW